MVPVLPARCPKAGRKKRFLTMSKHEYKDYRFERHVGRLRYSFEVQLPGMISDIMGAIKDFEARLNDPATLPFEKRKAVRELGRLESKLPELHQRIVDTRTEVDRLEHLDDVAVDRWYEERGWSIPSRKQPDNGESES